VTKNIKKAIVTASLATALLVAPTTAMANSIVQTGSSNVIEISTTDIAAAVNSTIGNQASTSLRDIAIAAGATDIVWNEANRTVLIRFNGASVASLVQSHFGLDLSGAVHSGNFSLQVSFDGHSVTIPGTGLYLGASIENDRIVLDTSFLSLLTGNPASLTGSLAMFFIETVVQNAHGVGSASVTANGDRLVITVTQ